MFCQACGTPNPQNARFCSKCGAELAALAVSQRHSEPGTVLVEYSAEALPAFGRTLLVMLAALLVIPLPWATASWIRWFWSKIRFSDGTTLEFHGQAREILIPGIAAGLLGLINFGSSRAIEDRDLGFGASIAGILIYAALSTFLNLILFRWAAEKTRLSSGPSLRFTATYAGMFGWAVLVGLSVYTIIGWAWAVAAMYRWYARKTEGAGIEFGFTGQGWEILVRTLALICGCLFIIPIPWLLNWYVKWVVESFTMTRTAAPAMAEAA